jgi:hypothetical protein
MRVGLSSIQQGHVVMNSRVCGCVCTPKHHSQMMEWAGWQRASWQQVCWPPLPTLARCVILVGLLFVPLLSCSCAAWRRTCPCLASLLVTSGPSLGLVALTTATCPWTTSASVSDIGSPSFGRPPQFMGACSCALVSREHAPVHLCLLHLHVSCANAVGACSQP